MLGAERSRMATHNQSNRRAMQSAARMEQRTVRRYWRRERAAAYWEPEGSPKHNTRRCRCRCACRNRAVNHLSDLPPVRGPHGSPCRPWPFRPCSPHQCRHAWRRRANHPCPLRIPETTPQKMQRGDGATRTSGCDGTCNATSSIWCPETSVT